MIALLAEWRELFLHMNLSLNAAKSQVFSCHLTPEIIALYAEALFQRQQLLMTEMTLPGMKPFPLALLS